MLTNSPPPPAAAVQVEGVYRPRFDLDPRVIRVPIVPGTDPRLVYGDVAARGIKGIVLEAFGVGERVLRQRSGGRIAVGSRAKGAHVSG